MLTRYSFLTIGVAALLVSACASDDSASTSQSGVLPATLGSQPSSLPTTRYVKRGAYELFRTAGGSEAVVFNRATHRPGDPIVINLPGNSFQNTGLKVATLMARFGSGTNYLTIGLERRHGNVPERWNRPIEIAQIGREVDSLLTRYQTDRYVIVGQSSGLVAAIRKFVKDRRAVCLISAAGPLNYAEQQSRLTLEMIPGRTSYSLPPDIIDPKNSIDDLPSDRPFVHMQNRGDLVVPWDLAVEFERKVAGKANFTLVDNKGFLGGPVKRRGSQRQIPSLHWPFEKLSFVIQEHCNLTRDTQVAESG